MPDEQPPARLRLHLDADASIRALERALTERGHDVTRTRPSGCRSTPPTSSNSSPPPLTTAALFTFNVRDFSLLAHTHPHHAGLLLAHQLEWNLPSLIAPLDRFLGESPEARGCVLWLNDWQ